MKETKKCTKCGEEKGLDLFYKDNKGAKKRTAKCKKCQYDYTHARLDKIRELRKTNNYKEYQRGYIREYDKSNHRKSYKNQNKRKHAALLADWYIIDKLRERGICKEAITDDLINLKRMKIELYRITKQKENELTKTNID